MKLEVRVLSAAINVEIVLQVLRIVLHVLIPTDPLPLHVVVMQPIMMMELMLLVKLVFTLV